MRFLPRVPKLMAPYYSEEYARGVEEAFDKKSVESERVYAAAWMLMLDVWLWVHEGFDEPDESPYKRIAQLTRDVDEAPLRIAHCIRDLAYGDESRADNLVEMVESDEPAYKDIFVRCYWRDA